MNIRRVILLSALALLPGPVWLRAKSTPSRTVQVSELMKRGNQLMDLHDWIGALQDFQEAVRISPDDAGAHVGVGRALGEQGDKDGALAEFKEALRLNPGSAEAHNGVGWILGIKGDVEGALVEYREAVRLKPDYAKAHYNVGWALNQKNDLDGALREYREAIRLKPHDPDFHTSVAWVLKKKGDWDGALQEYQKAIQLKPDALDLHQALGSAYFERKDFDAALREYREEVRLNPASAPAHCDAGLALIRKGDWNGAMAEHREAIRLQPDDAEAHAEFAFDLGHQHNWDGEIRESREAIRLQPKHARAHFYLGRGLEQKGERRGALDEYREAARLAPADAAIASSYDRLKSDMNVLPGNWPPAMVRAFTISAALVPSFLLLGYFRARDLYPEPARALWATFFLGAFAIFPVLLLDWPLKQLVLKFHGPLANGLAEAFFTAALPEELLKFAVVVLFCARLKAFNEPMDGIVYGAVASLGFATLENVGYVTANGLGIAVCRAFTSVPGHAFMGAVMGYFVGQWRFGLPAQRATALVKAYLVPMSLHWFYDFPLLAYGAASRLTGTAKLTAVDEIAPLMILSVAILVLETIWGVRLVNRLRREQIQFTRDAVAAAAAAEGAMDIAALVSAPDAPPSAWAGWLMALMGGLVATCGGFISLFVVILFAETSFHGDSNFNFLGGALVGGIPLLLGMVLFVYGVRRIHASRRPAPPPALAVPAGA